MRVQADVMQLASKALHIHRIDFRGAPKCAVYHYFSEHLSCEMRGLTPPSYSWFCRFAARPKPAMWVRPAPKVKGSQRDSQETAGSVPRRSTQARATGAGSTALTSRSFSHAAATETNTLMGASNV
jgi:hypothetical protein